LYGGRTDAAILQAKVMPGGGVAKGPLLFGTREAEIGWRGKGPLTERLACGLERRQGEVPILCRIVETRHARSSSTTDSVNSPTVRNSPTPSR